MGTHYVDMPPVSEQTVIITIDCPQHDGEWETYRRDKGGIWKDSTDTTVGNDEQFFRDFRGVFAELLTHIGVQP